MTQLDLQSAERKRAANAAAAAAREVSKNILDFRKRPQLAENAVQGSLGQNIRPVGTLGQQLMLRQNIPAVGVANKYQAVSSHSVLPAIAHNPLLPAGNQRPTGIQTQTLAASSVQAQYSGVADFYNLASIRPGGLSVPGGSTSSRSKLYSEDPLVYVSRASDKKGSSYSYSLSNMSKYNP